MLFRVAGVTLVAVLASSAVAAQDVVGEVGVRFFLRGTVTEVRSNVITLKPRAGGEPNPQPVAIDMMEGWTVGLLTPVDETESYRESRRANELTQATAAWA